MIAAAAAAMLADGRARGAADQAQGPFLLVAGLLLLGLVAHADGLFGWASARLLGVTTAPRRLLAVALALVAVVTALLNLDTAVVFLTPILIGAARGIAVDEAPFLYGSVLMANASSLLLPGANLTNLLVLSSEPVGGATFVRRLLPAALAAAVVTAAGLLLLFRRALHVRGRPHARPAAPRVRALGVAACAAAAALVLALPHPGLPVLALGLVAAAVRVRDGALRPGELVEAVGPLALLALFALSVLLGLLARSWGGPAELLDGASAWQTTAIAAGASIGVNNLPAAVLLSATPPAHPRALLLGLDVGPNLAVTGALSAYLWLRTARATGCEPSVVRFSAIGVPLALVAMLAGLAAMVFAGRT